MGTDFSKKFAASIFRLGQQNIMTFGAVLDYLKDRGSLSISPSVNKPWCAWIRVS